MRLPKLIFGLCLGWWALASSWANQTVVTIQMKDGSIVQYDMDESGKISFDDDNLMIAETSLKAASAYALSAVQRVTFSNPTDLIDVKSGELSVFPNPTTDNVYVAKAKEGDEVEILSYVGSVVKKTVYSAQIGVSMKELPVGFYIVRLNGQSYKISKR